MISSGVPKYGIMNWSHMMISTSCFRDFLSTRELRSIVDDKFDHELACGGYLKISYF